MTRILFVCLGNICRSPLAEAIFNHKIKEMGLSETFHVDSCATAGYNLGDTPDARTIKNAMKNGVAINHRARLLLPEDLDSFDHIIVMDDQNLRNVKAISSPKQLFKIKLMRTFDPVGPGEVPDPYYGDEEDFQSVFEILNRSMEAFIQSMIPARA